MSVIEINRDPSVREVKQFSWMLLAFAGALGGMVLWRPEALVGAAGFLAVAVAVSLVLNNDSPRTRQLWGLLLPGLFGLIGLSVAAGVRPWAVAWLVWAAGGALGVAVGVAPSIGRNFYLGWMSAAEPIGWTISHAILAIVFYLVITPIGLVLRCLGHDPLQRRFNPGAATYWQRRKPVADIKRYFRQF